MTGTPFFTLPDGRTASLYRLRLPDGFGADVTDFGGCVTALRTFDRFGVLRDVALSWQEPAVYAENPGYLGALVGRIPNRIGGGRFTLDGRTYSLVRNERGCTTLHGGDGYSHRLWEVENASPTRLTLTLRSPDGDAGFPGALFIRAAYSVRADHTLELEISAEADRRTVADFTSHVYLNLEGEGFGSCATHDIALAADRTTETDDFLIPTGATRPVAGGRFDLRPGRSFADILAETPDGFDDNFILAERDHVWHENCAVVTARQSGIRLRLHTSRPGVQFYMGKYLSDAPYAGKSGRPYPAFGGFCLETQCWPDAVNHPDFPPVTVEPGRPFHGLTRWQFDYLR